jgi:molybdenum cofactor biosynthesis protein B
LSGPEKQLDGFGELFRMISYHAIARRDDERGDGRASANRIIIALPGSEAAVRLAMEKLVLPELGHLVQQARK